MNALFSQKCYSAPFLGVSIMVNLPKIPIQLPAALRGVANFNFEFYTTLKGK